MTSAPPLRPGLLARRELGVWWLLLDLYRRKGAFAGFLEFAVIGGIVILFLNPPYFSQGTWIARQLASLSNTAMQYLISKEHGADQMVTQRRFPTAHQIDLDVAAFASSAPQTRQRLADAATFYKAAEYAAATRLLESAPRDDRNVLLLSGLSKIAQTRDAGARDGVADLEQAALAGQGQAMSYLALALTGTLSGVKADLAQARLWLERGVERGDMMAARLLADSLVSGTLGVSDPARAVQYYRLAVERGDKDSAFTLGSMLLTGQGVAKDQADGERVLRIAAGAGQSQAQFILGQHLLSLYGMGWASDPSEAVEWLTKATAQKVPQAMFWLGVFHAEVAKGAPWQDMAKGVGWFQRCARETWYLDCLYAYAAALDGGLGIPRDAPMAYAYYNLVASSGNGKGKAPGRAKELRAGFSPEEARRADAAVRALDVSKPPIPLANIGKTVQFVPQTALPDTRSLRARYASELDGIAGPIPTFQPHQRPVPPKAPADRVTIYD